MGILQLCTEYYTKIIEEAFFLSKNLLSSLIGQIELTHYTHAYFTVCISIRLYNYATCPKLTHKPRAQTHSPTLLKHTPPPPQHTILPPSDLQTSLTDRDLTTTHTHTHTHPTHTQNDMVTLKKKWSILF